MLPRKDTSMELALGPMSPEIVEAVFRYSHFHRKPLMLIASKNQIDYNGGYVNGWTTQEYMTFVSEMRASHPLAKVTVCRDHCGPGFNGKQDMEDVYATIEHDIKNGFDLIHIDFCHYLGDKDEQLKASQEAILHCQKLNSSILLEIGTDENTGTGYSLPNLAEWERDIDFFKSFCSPQYYVVQTGSLVKEIDQVGTLNKTFVERAAGMLNSKGIKLKEHNADYLSRSQIDERRGIVDAQNIAPQLGVIQTQTILLKCLIYGISTERFEQVVYHGGKWKKWLHTNTPENKKLCTMIAGHYHFTSPEYRHILEELANCEDIKETIIANVESVIDHYVTG